jgi:hypothetical protein
MNLFFAFERNGDAPQKHNERLGDSGYVKDNHPEARANHVDFPSRIAASLGGLDTAITDSLPADVESIGLQNSETDATSEATKEDRLVVDMSQAVSSKKAVNNTIALAPADCTEVPTEASISEDSDEVIVGKTLRDHDDQPHRSKKSDNQNDRIGDQDCSDPQELNVGTRNGSSDAKVQGDRMEKIIAGTLGPVTSAGPEQTLAAAAPNGGGEDGDESDGKGFKDVSDENSNGDKDILDANVSGFPDEASQTPELVDNTSVLNSVTTHLDEQQFNACAFRVQKKQICDLRRDHTMQGDIQDKVLEGIHQGMDMFKETTNACVPISMALVGHFFQHGFGSFLSHLEKVLEDSVVKVVAIRSSLRAEWKEAGKIGEDEDVFTALFLSVDVAKDF